MARERISLVSEEVKKQQDLEESIRSGEINPETFSELSAEQQAEVNGILFKMASEKVEPNQGTSALEFILFGFMRIMHKRIHGMSLTRDEKEIEQSLDKIMSNHEITNTETAKKDWLFDYMGYAEAKSDEFLRNREEHITRKLEITGKA
jgi:hypothetical protein